MVVSRLRSRVAWLVAVSLMMAAGVVLLPQTSAEAATVTISQLWARMSDQVATETLGGDPVLDQSGYCIRYGATGTPAQGAPNSSSSAWVDSGGTAMTSHGRPSGTACPGALSTSTQSVIGYRPAAVTAVTTDVLLNLGAFVHYNNPVSGGTSPYYRGDLVLRINGVDMTFPWTMWETPNNAPCPEGGTGNQCDDVLTFVATAGDATISIGGLDYTIVINGFVNNGSSPTCAAQPSGPYGSSFKTAEGQTSYGCMYATLRQVRQLTLVKQAEAPYGLQGGTIPSFDYTGTSNQTGSAWAGSTSLTPTGLSAAGRASVTRPLVTGQTLTIAETAPAQTGWAMTSVQCIDGTGNAVSGVTISGPQITFAGDYSTSNAAAAPITCTYTNTYTPRSTLTLEKAVISTGQPSGLLASPYNWTLTASGTTTISGRGQTGQTTTTPNPAITSQAVISGTYTLGESANEADRTAGYLRDGAWTCRTATGSDVPVTNSQVTLAAGANVTCSVTNRYQTGTLAITKTVTAPAGAYTAGSSMAFTASYVCTLGGITVATGSVTVNPSATTGQPGSPATVPAIPAEATCTVTETAPPSGSINLANGSYTWSAPVNPAPVTITADRTATAGITDPVAQQLGSFRIAKAVTPRQGTPAAGYTGSATRAFPVTYACTLAGTEIRRETVNVQQGSPVTVGGIPATASCAVVSEVLVPQGGDFADSSYAWDGAVYPEAVQVTPGGTADALVTNYFRRDLSSLVLAKTVTGSGYTGSGAVFAIGYDCGADYAATVTVAAGGSSTVPVPANVACTVSETTPSSSLLAPGYVWGPPTFAGLTNGSVSVPAGQSATVTVTNPTLLGFGQIVVTKTIATHGDKVAAGAVFSVQVTCPVPAQGQTQNYAQTFDLTWPAEVSATTAYLPIGTTCTVTEVNQPTGSASLPDASYAWRPAPAPTTVQVPDSTTPATATVVNDIDRAYGTFAITKSVVNRTSLSAFEQNFSGTFRCSYNADETVVQGTWTRTGSGPATLSTGGTSVQVLIGSTCAVEETSASTPVPADLSYTWSITQPAATTVSANGATSTVINTLNRAVGPVTVTKSVSGGEAGTAFPATTVFRFSYTCTPGTGLAVVGQLEVDVAGSAALSESVPGGSTCTVTELADPTPIDPYRWDGVTFDVSGAASSEPQSGRSVTFVTPADGAVVTVAVTDTISRKTGSVAVTKRVVDPDGGFTGGSTALFPVTLTCGGVALGARSVADGGTVTWTDIPLGQECSATEGAIAGGLRDASFSWAAATVGAPVTLQTAGEVATIPVTNTTQRVVGQIAVDKTLDNGGFTGVVPADRTYSGTWTCVYGGTTPAVTVTGSWSGTAGGQITLTGPFTQVLVTSTCSLTESALAAPSADPSFRWDTPAFTSATVAQAGPNRLSVTNTLVRDTGSIEVGKTLAGLTAGYTPQPGFVGFPVSATCFPVDPSSPGQMQEEVNVLPGEQKTLIVGVPLGWTCQVSEGAYPTEPTQLYDSSYAWSDKVVSIDGGGSSVVITGRHVATVTNTISRVTGTLDVVKQFGDQATATAVADGTVFSGTFGCTSTTPTGPESYTGTWSVTGAGSATLAGATVVPLGSTCSVSEDALTSASLPDASWAWQPAVVTEPVVVQSSAQPAVATVTNTAERVYQSLSVTKRFDGPAASLVDGAAVTGAWSCVYGSDAPVSGPWTLPASGGTVQVVTATDRRVLATSDCTVTETTLSQDLLVDSSYGWDQPVITSSGDAVAQAVTVANSVHRVYGQLQVGKVYSLGSGVAPAAIDSSLMFSGSWTCTHGSEAPQTGTWGPVSVGGTWTSGDILLGSSCTATENALTSPPVAADASYVWAGQSVTGPVTIVPEGTAALLVTNTINRQTGSFSVTKQAVTPQGGISADAEYSFTWQCTAANGDLFPGADPGSIALTDGLTWRSPSSVPVGSSCAVSEVNLPEPSDPSYTWTTAMTVTGAEAITEGTSTSFVLPATDVSVLSVNTLTRTNGTYTVTKASDPATGSVVNPGQTITYTVTVAGGPVGFTDDVVVTDDLSQVLTHASSPTDITVGQGTATVSGQSLVWSVGRVQADQTITLTYTVRVDDSASGVTITNLITTTSEFGEHPCEVDCSTRHTSPAWTLSKSSNPGTGSVVKPGDTITYTLTATNTGPAPLVAAVASDDLSQVMDDAVLGTLPDGTSLSDTTLTWQVPTVPVGGSVMVSYTVTVNQTAVAATLTNVVTPTSPGGSCTLECSTTSTTDGWTLTKAADPDTAQVNPGDTITYTLTVTNTGAGPLSGAVVHDDLSQVLDDAVLGSLPAGTSFSGTTLTWQVPTVAPKGTTTLSYTVTVNGSAWSATLRNTATPATSGGVCQSACTTTHTTGKQPGGPPLPGTGSSVSTGLIVGGGALLVAGFVLVGVTVRRRRS